MATTEEMGAALVPTGGPFAASSFWKTRLPDNAPLHPSSDVWRRNLCSQMGLNADTGRPLSGALPGLVSFQISACGAPCYVVPPGTPLTKMTVIDHAEGWQNLQTLLTQGVPVPAGAKANNCSDEHLTIWQPSSDTYWEFWHFKTTTTGASCRWGGVMQQCSRNHGRFENNTSPLQGRMWGCTATSLPLIGGSVQHGEVQAGGVAHAVPLVVKEAFTQSVYPAQRDDGRINDPSWIPEGARIRFPPGTDLSRVKGNARCIAEAIRDYGAFVIDRTGTGCAIKFRDSSIGSAGSWKTLFPEYSGNYMWSMPWHQAQVVDPSVSQPH